MSREHDELGWTVSVTGNSGDVIDLKTVLHAAGAGKDGGTWNKDLEPYAAISIRTTAGAAFIVPTGGPAVASSFRFSTSGAVLGPVKYDDVPSLRFNSDGQGVRLNLIFKNGGN